MKRRAADTAVLLLCLAALLAGIVAVQRAFDRRYLSSEQSVRELLYFPSADVVRALSAGNQLMMADYLWLRMIQYYGYHMRSDRNYEYLHPITDRLTDLDPQFLYPYTFGSLLLAHDAQDSVNSLRLLDKAKRENPDRWEFPYMKGFILYIFFQRPDSAVAEFIEASKLPDAWEGALRFAAWISRKQGRRETSKQMWQDQYGSAKSQEEQAVAKYYLDKIGIEEELDRLQIVAVRFRKTSNRWPASLRELFAAGAVKAARDPFGGTYYWSAADSSVRNTTNDAMLKQLGGRR
ncbi:MAG: hypothetical protein MUF78_10255 [Candidatus Edwardsbacteria bacterium]|jgi:hypothetical protein|nr:hypothetical protein [Candidatus Edwardsbacteria bacterium]